jgi:hypothetical protein
MSKQACASRKSKSNENQRAKESEKRMTNRRVICAQLRLSNACRKSGNTSGERVVSENSSLIWKRKASANKTKNRKENHRTFERNDEISSI